MRKIILVMLLAALVGCANRPKPAGYGSFAAAANPAGGQKMADDVVTKLVTLYPPAVTRFNLQHAAADPFGTLLVARLRAKGYALQEFKAAPKRGDADKGSSRALAYVFDQPTGTDLYRVTVTIDEQSLSRVYQAKDGSVAPASYWVRKE